MKYKIFTVTKNEYDLIESFILYYGSNFGYDNVIIIDNGSDNNDVLNIYSKYKVKGVKIHTELGYKNNLQGDHFTKYMKMYKTEADWLIGLDTDEFLVLNDDNNVFYSDNLKSKLDDILTTIDTSIDIIQVNYRFV